VTWIGLVTRRIGEVNFGWGMKDGLGPLRFAGEEEGDGILGDVLGGD